jgi:hypothetical protein
LQSYAKEEENGVDYSGQNDITLSRYKNRVAQLCWLCCHPADLFDSVQYQELFNFGLAGWLNYLTQ